MNRRGGQQRPNVPPVDQRPEPPPPPPPPDIGATYTQPCGCGVRITLEPVGPVGVPSRPVVALHIVHCALHGSAPRMLEALEAVNHAMAVTDQVTEFPGVVVAVVDAIRAARGNE